MLDDHLYNIRSTNIGYKPIHDFRQRKNYGHLRNAFWEQYLDLSERRRQEEKEIT
jgi:hypothetical protein